MNIPFPLIHHGFSMGLTLNIFSNMKQYIQHGLPDFSRIKLPLQQPDPENTKPLAPSDMINLPGNVIIGLLRFISTLDYPSAAEHPSATNMTRSVKIGEIASRKYQ